MLLLDLHFAGTDTSSNSILTALLYLATHTHIQGEWMHTHTLALAQWAKVSLIVTQVALGLILIGYVMLSLQTVPT